MHITTPVTVIRWNGGHYGNIFDKRGNEIDVFSFAWEKNSPTALDFLEGARHYLAYSLED